MPTLKLQRKDFLLFIERLTLRAHIPFMRGIVFFSLVMFVGKWVTEFATGISWTPLDIYLEFMWSWPGAVSIVTIMFFSRRLRDKSLFYINEVSLFIKPEEYAVIEERLKKTFVKSYSVVLPLIVSFMIAVPLQTYSLILNPSDPFWKNLRQYSPTGATVYGGWAVFSTWLVLSFILTIGYYSLGIAYTLNKIEKQLLPLSVEEIDRGLMKSLGSLLMCMTSSFLLGIGINLALITVAPLAWWSVTQIALFVLGALLLFFVPLYNLHVFVENKKDEAIRDVKARWWDALKRDDLRKIRAISSIEQRISRVPSWPFNTRTLLELSGYILIPLLVWLISYLSR
jgi:hypothetical protein